MKLSSMTEKVRTIQVEWEGDTADVGIYPGRYTPNLLQQVADTIAEAGSKGMDDQLAAVGSMVEPILAWWDLYVDDEAEANGERMPTDADTIAQLPVTFTMAVLQAAAAAIRPPANGS